MYNDYADEDIPDADPEPYPEPPVPPSPCPLPPLPQSPSPVPPLDLPAVSLSPSQSCPLPRRPARYGRRSQPPINVTQLMRLAGGMGLATAISCADAHTDSFSVAIGSESWEVPSERAGGESRRIRHKRKAKEISRSAAEDFALLTSRTTSEHHAADFLSTVANVIPAGPSPTKLTCRDRDLDEYIFIVA